MKFRFTSILISQLFFTASFSQTTIPVDSLKLNAIVEKVEKEAFFPGGEPAWKQYLEKSIGGFSPADNSAPVGYYTVIVQFIVDKDGSTSEVKALTKEGYGMEEEVKKIILKSGKWEPAILNGQTVKAYRKQPVSFIVEQDGIKFISQKPYTFYIGVTNELTIHVDKVKDENLSVIITKGTIVPTGNGIFKVRVTVPGRVVISVFNAKKDDRLLGAASFTVLPMDDIKQKQ